MPYEASSISEAYSMWMYDALPHVEGLARALGITVADNKPWVESKHSIGQFYREGERDRIMYSPICPLVKQDRTSGDPVPVGEKKNEQAIIEKIDTRQDKTETTIRLNQGRTLTRELVKTKSQTHGWDVSATLGFSVGKDDANKLTGEFTVAAHGEYSDEKAESSSTELSSGAEIEKVVQPGGVWRMVRMVQSGEVKVPYVDILVFDPSITIVDWHEMKKWSPLRGNADKKDYKKTRSDILMVCDNISVDLVRIITGRHNEYPGFQREDWSQKPEVKVHLDWLTHEKNRQITVKSEAIYKEGVWGETQLIADE